MPETFDAREEVRHGREPDHAFAKSAAGDDFGFEVGPVIRLVINQRLRGSVTIEVNLLSDANLSSRPNQALPFIWIVTELMGQKNLDASLKEVAGGGILRAYGLRALAAPTPVKAGWKDSRVIENQQVVRSKKVRKLTKSAILASRRDALWTRPAKVEHARGSAVHQRDLRDAFRWQMVVEVRNKHWENYRV